MTSPSLRSSVEGFGLEAEARMTTWHVMVPAENQADTGHSQDASEGNHSLLAGCGCVCEREREREREREGSWDVIVCFTQLFKSVLIIQKGMTQHYVL